uniref:Peptidase S1 domain-containing protein n=1 Tax=Pygocentrus nattereri TaxID=42514 RepID=A0A3B4C501_PYGNA
MQVVFDSQRLDDRMNALHQVLLAALFSALVFDATYGEEIIHGRKAKKNSLQYMASVQVNGKHKCGGFLIDASYVLTAAHCDDRDNMSVVLGAQDISRNNLVRYVVKSKHKHPSYKDPKTGNDIMLLKLSSSVKQGKFVKIVKIPSKDKPLKPKTKCQVAGWGKTEKQNSVNDLLVTDVSTVSLKDCQKEWAIVKIKPPPNVLCAGGYGTKSGACQGDSGGPLVCSGTAVGIVSFNFNGDCNYPNVPNVYTQISKFTTWIKKTIKKGA